MSNFTFLKKHNPIFFQLAQTAEQVFSADPNTTLIKLRQLGEALAQDLAARSGIEFEEHTTQSDLIFKLNRKIHLDPTIQTLFHTLRREGNRANHEFRTQHKEAMDGLKVGRALALWFHSVVDPSGATFKPGPFVSPPDPSEELRRLQSEIQQLKAALSSSHDELKTNNELANLVAREKEEYAVLAHQMRSLSRKMSLFMPRLL